MNTREKLERLMRLRYVTPPPTVLVLFEGKPVAELKMAQGKYFFEYLPAFHQLGLAPLPGLRTDQTNVSEDLFPFFAERIPDIRRPEIRERIKKLGVSENDKLALLERLGRTSVTDSFELQFTPAA